MALTPLKFSALTAGAALGGTEIIPMVQAANNRYATPATIKDYTLGFALSKTGDTGVGIYSFLAASHTPQAGPAGTAFIVSNQGAGLSTRLLFDNYATGAGGVNLTFRKARNTAAAPSALASGDQLINIAAFGYGTTVYSASTRAGIVAAATEAWTDAAHGTYIYFHATPTGTASVVEHLRCQDNVVRLGNTGIIALHMGGANVVLDTDRLYNARSYTVATLPTPGTAGRVAWASNCRVFNGAGTQEGAGVGTGGLVTDNGTAWKIAGTNVTAVA